MFFPHRLSFKSNIGSRNGRVKRKIVLSLSLTLQPVHENSRKSRRFFTRAGYLCHLRRILHTLSNEPLSTKIRYKLFYKQHFYKQREAEIGKKN